MDTTVKSIKSVGVLCSGGDSPGMNAAVRSVVRTAIGLGIDVFGIYKGYSGLLEGNIQRLGLTSVSNIIQRGGTILDTSRCLEFHTPEIRLEAAHILSRKHIDGLVVIGGNGSFAGAMELHIEHGVPVIGIPGTIDNDISGTEYTIGFNTAVQTAVDAVDKIRDTASAHARTFLIEVMGHRSSSIALQVGVCTGAEHVVLSNQVINYDKIAGDIKKGAERGKTSSIIIVAEREKSGLSYQIKEVLMNQYAIAVHACVLGHIQRGGSPTALDRLIASRMGYAAAHALHQGLQAHVTAINNGQLVMVPLAECLEGKNEAPEPELDLISALAI
ncbi:ATP-dependent 6-phosphofructokinase [Methylovulum sp.]|uniref:ATP-dependent 6-phosphofructokinase n=1 Tax=Methylovulum sp. TaxID=1916980 RepID=UPI002632FCAD|nr:ATP-dependent 6-phosphofructokinase [Methylovulum sp.]MDD5126260.1 ATP-dependent 6-phosphofructokinase [Methylovulum sp.]